MIPQKRFKLKSQAILLAAISAAFPVTAYCAAGRVDFVIGNVEAIGTTGTRHPLSKGAEINAGEAISTAAGARAQVRFADGGYVSIQPNTMFRVDEFNYQNKTDGEEKGFFSLLKGGFRAITGAIGHVNKNTYRVKTPAATLGIRGTGYNMALRDDGLFVNVGEGAISLINNAGLLVVTAGGAAYVANFNTAPVPTARIPLTPPNGLKEPEFTVADQRNSVGNLTLLQAIPINLVSGSNYVMSYSYTGNTAVGGPASGSVGLAPPVTATFGANSQLTQYSAITDTGSIAAGQVTLAVSDGIIGWGRWTGAFTTTGPAAVLTSPTLDYVVGIPTAAMPTTGTATYTLLGYLTPTTTQVGQAPYTVSGNLSVNFGANGNVAVNMTVANAANSYTTGATPVTLTGSTFTGTIATTSLAGSTLPCSGSCNTSVNGFFAGTNAARAGLSYTISNISGGSTIQGVAAFTR